MTGVCAIVPTYNRASLLPETISAILGQSRPVSRLIVVDDGSSDATAAYLDGLPDTITRLRVENGGKARALNVALELCTCEAVWICDDDDIALPHAVETLAGVLETSRADFCFGTYERFHVDETTGERHLLPRGYWPDLAGRSLFVALAEDFFMFQNATLVRTSALRRVGPFREDLVRSQDYEMALRLTHACTGAHIDTPVFLQREHAGTRGTSAQTIDATQVDARWMEADRSIWRALHRRFALDDFARELQVGGSLRRRGALLQRACAAARRKLWPMALADMKAAAAAPAAGPLTREEVAICGRFLLSKYGCEEIVSDPDVRKALLRFGRAGPLAAAIAKAIADPLLWRSREAAARGRVREAGAYLGVLLDLAGVSGATARLGARAAALLGRRKAASARDPKQGTRLSEPSARTVRR